MNTTALTPGTRVLTTDPDGDDFGIPLVSPAQLTSRGRGAVVREVRRRCRVQGGTVVWFTDGTKSHVAHGRTMWLVQ